MKKLQISKVFNKYKKSKPAKIVIVGLLFLTLGLFILFNGGKKSLYSSIVNTLKYRTMASYDNVNVTSAYVNDSDIVDGTKDFDADDAPGNDSSATNKIVRSFDNIYYTINYTTGIKPTSSESSYDEAIMQVEFTLPYSDEEATFDTASMNWLLNPNVEKVTDSSGNVIKQILTGQREIKKGDSPTAVPGSGTLSAVVKVLGMKNNATIKPTFKLWMDGNADSESKSADPTSIKVSAYPKYNIQLTQNSYLSYKDTFDLDVGNSATSTSTNTVEGRMYGYGVGVMLYNDSASKGLKGVEIPKGDITFDLDLKTELANGSTVADVTSQYTPILWDYKLNRNSIKGNSNRNMVWKDNFNSGFSIYSIPYSKEQDSGLLKDNCYDSGEINATQSGNKINVTIKNYKFSDKFPVNPSGFDSVASTIGENIGYFATSYFEILAPFPTTALTTNENYYLTVSDSNMRTTSISGQAITTQKVTTDDTIKTQVYITSPGQYGKENWLSSMEDKFLYSKQGKGDGWSTPGTNIKIAGVYFIGEKNDKDKYVYGVNFLQKFDDEAFEIPSGANQDSFTLSTASGENTMTHKLLYAAKKDGTGWVSDAEMLNTREEDLVYYKTIDELNDDGKICVAVLLEGRDGYSYARNNVMKFNVKVKETAEIGKVYQTVNDVRIWDERHKLTFDDTRSDNSTGGILNNPDVTVYLNYVKSEYDEDGQIKTGTHLNGYYGGQSLLIVGYEAGITKSVDQVNSSKPKKTYDVGIGERRVDFVLSPSVKLAGGKEGISSQKTIVTIKDILPKGLSYVTNSSTYGGTYTTDATTNGGTLSGGVKKEPSMSVNASGEVVLTWTFENITPGEKMEKIHYQAMIGDASDPDNDVKNGESLLNTTTIQAVGDGRALLEAFGNKATYSVNVIKLSEAKLIKKVETPLVEVGEDVAYSITYTNTSENEIKGLKLLDVLPYNEDTRGTKYDGTYTVKSITLDKTSAQNADLEMYYTTEKLTDEDAKNVNISDLVKATKTVSGNTVTYAVDSKAKSILLAGSMDGKEKIKVTLTIKPSNNKSANVYGNEATLYSNGQEVSILAPNVQAKVVKRTISGQVWNDKNKNGIKEESEIKIEGATVKLLDDTGNAAKDVYGNEIAAVKTSSTGKYSFTNLKEGKYKVVLTGNSETVIKDYVVTSLKATGVDESINNDGVGTYEDKELTSVNISGITLPAKDDMIFYTHEEKDLDIGLYSRKYLMIDNVTKNPKDKDKTDVGGTVTLNGVTNSDEVAYTEDGLAVSFTNDELYIHNSMMKIKYLDDGTWKEVELKVPTESGKIEDLKAIFPNASSNVNTVNGKTTVKIQLGASTDEMYDKVKVEVSFLPTLKIYNNTEDNKYGNVEIENKSTVEDGRYNKTEATGIPDLGYQVDFDNLTINSVGGEEQYLSVGENKVEINGVEVIVTVVKDDTGKVTVSLDKLNIPLDIGVKFIEELVDYQVIKVWDDYDNANNKRPEKIVIYLYKNDELLDTKEVTGKDKWSCTFKDLKKYDEGVINKYFVKEEPVESYGIEIKEEGYKSTITNRLTSIITNENSPTTNDTLSKESLLFFIVTCLTALVITISIYIVIRKKNNLEVI